jgi:hypothetical protein
LHSEQNRLGDIFCGNSMIKGPKRVGSILMGQTTVGPDLVAPFDLICEMTIDENLQPRKSKKGPPHGDQEM